MKLKFICTDKVKREGIRISYGDKSYKEGDILIIDREKEQEFSSSYIRGYFRYIGIIQPDKKVLVTKKSEIKTKKKEKLKTRKKETRIKKDKKALGIPKGFKRDIIINEKPDIKIYNIEKEVEDDKNN